MIEEGQEYTTPEYDDDGNLIETLGEYDVFVEDEIPEEDHDDSYYQAEEGDLAELDYAEEDNVDPIESKILESQERYEMARDAVIERLTAILEKGEISSEDNADLNDVMQDYTDSVNDIKDKITEDTQGNNDTSADNEINTSYVLPEELQHLVDLLNNGGRNDLLFIDEEGRVLVEGEQVPKLKLVELEVQKLVADYAEITELVAGKATIEDLNAVKAQIGTLEVGEVIADTIHSNKANIGQLDTDLGKIETLVGGNLTMDNIQSLILSSQKVTVENAFIKDAMIDTISANKLNTGSINTNLVNIQSEDGSLLLNGTLQQFKDQNGKVRIQMGKDAQGNFTFGLFDSTGTGTLIDSNGITEKAIGDGLIVNDMVNENANISGSKLDINSVITSINNGTTSIKGSKIKLDTQNQTLDLAFNTLNTTVTETGKTVESQGTSIETMQGEIKTLITNTTITEGETTTTIKDAYSSLKQDVDEFGVSLKSVESDFNNLKIGTRNLLSNSAPTSLAGYSLNTATNWNYALIDCPTATKGKSIRVTNVNKSSGGVYTFPIKKDGLINGETYTVSVMMRASNNNIRMTVRQEQMVDSTMINMSTDWKLITFTSKVDTSKTSKGVVMYVDMNSINVGDWFEFHSIMLENSTKPSNFTEAPEDIQSSMDSLGTRVQSAESKLTLNGLTTIIGNTYITPTQLSSKGYATTSDVTQSVNSWVAKFNESGGYNLFYNGNFKGGFNQWGNSGSNIIVNDVSCPTNPTAIKFVGATGASKAVYQSVGSMEEPLNIDKPLVISMWGYLTSSGTDGTTNPYHGFAFSIIYTDGTKTYPGNNFAEKGYDKWNRYTATLTPTTGKKIAKIEFQVLLRDSTKTMYVTDIILSIGSTEVPFACNPNEAYDGIITLDKSGIRIDQSNYNGFFKAEASKVLLNNGKEDVVKCDSNGLYVKGQIHVTSGSISDEAFAGTTVDGKYIKTNSILTKHLAIGDFSNYCPVTPDNCSQFGYRKIVDTVNGDWIQVDTPTRDMGLCASHYEEYTGNVSGTYRISATFSTTVKGEVTRDTGIIDYLRVSIGLYCTLKDNTTKAWYVPVGVLSNSTGSIQKLNSTVTIPENVKSFGVALQHSGWGSFSGVTKVKDIVVNKMMSGSLIVDGAIDGRTIRGAEIVGGYIRSADVNADNQPVFSLSSDGTIIGANIDCLSLNVDGEMSADTLNIDNINCSWYPQSLDEDITVYINAGVTSATDWEDGAKFSSMEDLFAVMPRNLNGYTLFIIFETDYNGNLHLSRFNSGSCYLYLQKHTIRGYIYVYGQSMRYAIYGNTRGVEGGTANCADIKPPKGKSQSGYAYTIVCDYCSLTCYDLNIYPGVDTTVEPSGIIVTNFSKAYLSNINAVGNPKHLVRSHSSSHVYVAGSSGLTTSNTFSAVSGSLQMLNKTTQAGTTTTISEVYTSGNAQVFKDGVTFTKADNSGTNDSGSSTTETNVVTLKASSGNTFRRTVYNSWKNDGSVRQGDWGYGDCDGFWFFGSQISNYTSKNITKVEITIKRLTGAGYSSAVSHTLVGHNYASKPSGTPSAMGSAIRTFSLSAGSSVTLNLTASEITTFKKYKGIGLKSAYDASHYSNCSSACTVKITYTE